MQAYNNPVFVEDVVRNTALLLKKDKRVVKFSVRALNHESIHAHNAFAVVVSGNDFTTVPPQWWAKLDQAWANSKKMGGRMGRRTSPPRIEDRHANPLGRRLDEGICRGHRLQSVCPADAVGKMLKGVAFRKACLGYSMSKLADSKLQRFPDAHWKLPVTCIRFRTKIAKIIRCAQVLRQIEREHGSFNRYLQRFAIPRLLLSNERSRRSGCRRHPRCVRRRRGG